MKRLTYLIIPLVLSFVPLTVLKAVTENYTIAAGIGNPWIANPDEKIEGDEPDAAAYKKAYSMVLGEKWKEAINELSSFLKTVS